MYSWSERGQSWQPYQQPFRQPRSGPIYTPSGIIPDSSYAANWPELRQWVLQRDGHQCTNTTTDAYGNSYRCPNRSNLQIDHILPKSKGGSDYVQNLRTLCERCHSQRHPHMWAQYHTEHPEEFGYPQQGSYTQQPGYYPQHGYPQSGYPYQPQNFSYPQTYPFFAQQIHQPYFRYY